MSIQIARTTSQNPDFISLVKSLDAYLKVVDGDEHDFYDQYNSIQNLNQVVVLYNNDIPVACGAIKKYNHKSVEVKRMFTAAEHRGNGYAMKVLSELEKWAAELGYTSCVLETGSKQLEAIRLYKKSDYSISPNFGQYEGVANSICFIKNLT